MAQLVVNDLEDDVRSRLEHLAKQHGCSLEDEVRDILRDAVKQQQASAGGLGSRIAARFEGQGLDEDIPELRGFAITPPRFDR